MRYLIILLVLTSACATNRTRSTDPVLRVAIDAASISPGSYARLQKALVDSRQFVVVDRSTGFRAVVKEQELQQTTTRFGDNEKYALWHKLYGVGGIFVALQQCEEKHSIFGTDYLKCTINLTLINATTGEVMAVAEEFEDTGISIAPEWKDTVETLIDHYPKVFITKSDLNQTIKYDDTLVEYREKVVPANSKKELGMKAEDILK